MEDEKVVAEGGKQDGDSVGSSALLDDDTLLTWACCRYCHKRHEIRLVTHMGIPSYYIQGAEKENLMEGTQQEMRGKDLTSAPEQIVEQRVAMLEKAYLDICKSSAALHREARKWRDHDHLNGKVVVPVKGSFEL